MDPLLIVALLLLGTCTGFVAGLLGIGGGMLMVPFMTMLLGRGGIPEADIVKVAIATSLATVLFTSMSSVRAHHRRGAVRWALVRALAPGILAGSLAGSQIAGAVPWRVLAGFFGLFIGYSAIRMFAGRAVRTSVPLPGPVGLFGAGSGIGVLSALLGAGGGFITVPYLARRGVGIQEAVASSAACGFPIALAGTLGYVWAGRHLPMPAGTFGYVYLPALAVISVASMLTAPFGARVAHAIPQASLRWVFAGLLFALAAYMLGLAIRG